VPEAGELTLIIEQGETFHLVVTWGVRGDDPVAEPDGAPVDPDNGVIYQDDADAYFLFSDGDWYAFTPFDNSDGMARLQIRPSAVSHHVLLEISSPDDGITLGGDDGTFDLVIDAEQTSGLDFSRARHDLLFIGTSGDRTRVFQGEALLSLAVTR
jgi:hypothetical protein